MQRPKIVKRWLLVCALSCLAACGLGQPDLVQRGAAITVKVSSYDQAEKALFDLAQKYSGTEADRQRASSEKGRHSGWWRVLVPKANLDAFLGDIRGLGKVYGENLTLQNHADEYADLGHRAIRLREHEQRLSGILQASRRLRGGDILFVQERIFRASVDQDLLTQRREALARSAGTSSVIVKFFEPIEVKEEPQGPLGRAKAAFLAGLRSLALSAIDFIGTLMYLIVYALFFWILWLIFRKQIRKGFAHARSWMDLNQGKTGPPPPAEGP